MLVILCRGLTPLLLCILCIVLAAEAAAIPDTENKSAQASSFHINNCEFYCRNTPLC